MRVATFGPSTAWVGVGIEYDGRQFLLEGYGPVPPEALLDYDRLGQIDWAYAGLREWVQTLAAQGSAAQWSDTQSRGGFSRPAFQTAPSRSRIPSWAIVLIVLVALAPVAAAVAIPMALAHRAGGKTVTGPYNVKPGQFTIDLRSDPGDFVGGGRTYHFTQSNSSVTVTATGGHLAIVLHEAHGPATDSWWDGDFVEPVRLPVLMRGTYTGLQRYPFNDAAQGGLDWSGEGRGSNDLTGWFAIDKVSYDSDGRLSAITLRFEQHSENAGPALHGEIAWARAVQTASP